MRAAATPAHAKASCCRKARSGPSIADRALRPAIARRRRGDYGLDTYPVQLEVITAEQMMDAYSSVGMPVGYHHWSFGKQFLGHRESATSAARWGWPTRS
jgi:hypothetical protein